jgi:CheY-like chemotaxis protein
MNILIVDDIATNRKLLRVTLEAEGHTTLEAADGVEALQILAREKVDAIISDILMPNMDGFRLCHEIRKSESLRALPFIIYTGTYNSPDDMKLAQTIGADKYIMKPAPAWAMLAALREVVDKKAARPVPLAWAVGESYVLKQYSHVLVRKLEEKNAGLQQALMALQRTQNLASRNEQLEAEIAERRRTEAELARTQARLLETSHLAGMAEVATNVLHNVGNVLNSVNVSATLLVDRVRQSQISKLDRVVALFDEHRSDLGTFLTSGPKGNLVPGFLAQLSGDLRTEQEATLKELCLIRENIERINEVVAMQQRVAKVSDSKVLVEVKELMEDSLRLTLDPVGRPAAEIVREFEEVPSLLLEKHKLLSILKVLMSNAEFACNDSGRADRRLTLRIGRRVDSVVISVIDNGVGIPRENLTKIFNHGFTTKKDGHGFGLHNSALFAKELGGSLTVHSDGPGCGARFTLELPIPGTLPARATTLNQQPARSIAVLSATGD